MLSDPFLQHLHHLAQSDRVVSDELRGVLEEELAVALQRAREAHDGVVLSDETFLAFLATKIRPGASVIDALRELRVEPLYLVCACANGDASALRVLERSYLPRLDRALGRAGANGDKLVEVKQRLRERLLTCSENATPRIAEYSGQGDLERWLRAVAVRLAVDLFRSEGSARESDADLDGLALNEDDPELANLKSEYRPQVAAAMRAAFAELAPEARSDLRLYYIDAVRLEQLAALRRVAVSTMSRRLRAARELVLRETRRRMCEELALIGQDIDSILGLVRSRLDLSRKWLETGHSRDVPK